jgi:DNA-binding response OmpR family regulator
VANIQVSDEEEEDAFLLSLQALSASHGEQSMRDGEKAPIVLVTAKGDVLNNIKDALAHSNLAVLYTQNKHGAIALLERLTCEIDLAIIEVELPDFACDLIRQLTWRRRKPMKIIATTSLYPEPVLKKVRKLGVDAVAPNTISPKEWRQTIETVLGKPKVQAPGDTTPYDDVTGAAGADHSSLIGSKS